MKIQEILQELEKWAPLSFQEDYDNAGLLTGDPASDVTSALVSLDLTPEVIREAVEKHCDLVISHHPFIFHGLKKILSGSSEYEIIREAMVNGINLYAIHTNLDNSVTGLNQFLCDILKLKETRILAPKKNMLLKLVTFCPYDYADRVRQTLFDTGAGHIGNYDSCSYNTDGSGTFRALEGANPFVGNMNELHLEPEVRIEVIFPFYLEQKLIAALKTAHPYEEVAFDIYPLANEFARAGSGMIGTLDSPLPAGEFLEMVKKTFGIPVLRHSEHTGQQIRQVAVCSGSGSLLIPDAVKNGADALLTGDLKYHDFTGIRSSLLLADIGHYESEQWVKELISAILNRKFPNFAVLISEKEQNPVKYL